MCPIVAMTRHPGPKKPWILEHFAGDSTIRVDIVLNRVGLISTILLVCQGRMSNTNRPCRILDDNELEGLQWRKDAKELKTMQAFGHDSKEFPRAFVPEVKTVFSYHKRVSNFPRISPESMSRQNFYTTR
jgi:hypothetical protein